MSWSIFWKAGDHRQRSENKRRDVLFKRKTSAQAQEPNPLEQKVQTSYVSKMACEIMHNIVMDTIQLK